MKSPKCFAIRAASAAALAVIFAPAMGHAGVLLQDSFNYASTDAFNDVWSNDSQLTSESPMALSGSGLSFTGHFPSAGGAIHATINNQRAYAPLSSGIQVTGVTGDNSFAGQSYTLYTSYLVQFSNIANWMNTGAGVTLSEQEGNPLGVASGWSNTDPDTDIKVQGLNLGDRVDGSWSNAASGGQFEGTDAFTTGVTYLVLARYDITNADAGTYSPFAAKASVRGRMVVYQEGDALPATENDVVWDLDETATDANWVDNGPFRGENAIINVVGVNPNSNGNNNSLWDEVRVGTEFGDVMAIPEPSTYAALFGLGSLLIALRRRRR